MTHTAFVVLTILVVCGAHGVPLNDDGRPVRESKTMQQKEAEIVDRMIYLAEHNETFAKLVTDTFQLDAPQPRRIFHCDIIPPSPRTPTSVHRLRPGDIKVVGAIGDSLTAGRGVEGGVFGLLVDYRGLSWSIGGDDTYERTVTIPNILRKYNPNLHGYSTRTTERNAGFNVAVSGAKANDAFIQAQNLVSKMKADPKVNFEEDWKLITVFIGANDLCDWCDDEAMFATPNYRVHLKKTLDYLHDNVPRALVSLVNVINVEMAEELASGFVCSFVHAYACNCASNPRNPEDVKTLIQMRKGYQQAARELANSGVYDTRDDFTVVLQPFYEKTEAPRTGSGIDYSYFAADCFHFSKRGQQATAEALWNNMFEPVGFKRETWTPNEKFVCPTEDFPYLFTNKNSHY